MDTDEVVERPEGAMPTVITLRNLRRDEIPLVVKWTAAEGWHVSENMLASCWALDPGGFMAAVDDREQVVGCIGGCILDDKNAAGGLFIMRSDFRRRGIGKLLWEWRVAYVGDRNLGIAAASSRIKPNQKAGFLHLSYEIAVYTGIPDRSKLEPTTDSQFEIVRYEDSMFDDVLDYDAEVHTIERESFLQQWLDCDITTSFVAKCEDKVIGFGCIQPKEGQGYHVGPIFADEPGVAKVLFNNLALSIPEDTEIGLELARHQEVCQELVELHGFKHRNISRRMYNRWIVDIPVEKVFFITTCAISLA